MIAQNLSNLIAQTPVGQQKPSSALPGASADIFADLFDEPRELPMTDLTKTDAIGAMPVSVPGLLKSAALTERAAASDNPGAAPASSDGRLFGQISAPASPTFALPVPRKNTVEAADFPTGAKVPLIGVTPKVGPPEQATDPLANPRPMIAPPSIGGAPEPRSPVPDESSMRNTGMTDQVTATATEALRTIAEADKTEVPKPDQPATLIKPEMQPPAATADAGLVKKNAGQQLQNKEPELLSPPKAPTPIPVEPAPQPARAVAHAVTPGGPPSKTSQLADNAHQVAPEHQSPTETDASPLVDAKPVTRVEVRAFAPGPEFFTSLVASTDSAPEMGLSDTSRSGAQTADTSRALPILTDHAPRVVEAIVQAARALSDRPVELTLNPEELGRVKLTLKGSDGAMSVQLTVERPETLELLRRHIDLLAADLRQAGYERLTFAFAGQQGQSGQHPATPADRSAENPAHQAPVPDPHPAHVLSLSGDGLDLRI